MSTMKPKICKNCKNVCITGLKTVGKKWVPIYICGKSHKEVNSNDSCDDMYPHTVEDDHEKRRYYINDSISRQAAIDALENEVRLIDGYYIMDDEVINKDDAIEAIRLLPFIQPEIIHCKDCVWKQGAECVRFADVRPFSDDFCSRAERRSEQDD